MKKGFAGTVLLAVLFAGARIALAGDAHGHDHDHGEAAGPNGGEVQELGDSDGTHAELIHDPAKGKITLVLLVKDVKTPVAIKDAPKINMKGKDGNRQIAMKAVDPAKDGSASRFEAEDEEFKADPLDGRIAIQMGGKQYNVKLDPHAGHKH